MSNSRSSEGGVGEVYAPNLYAVRRDDGRMLTISGGWAHLSFSIGQLFLGEEKELPYSLSRTPWAEVMEVDHIPTLGVYDPSSPPGPQPRFSVYRITLIIGRPPKQTLPIFRRF